MRRYNRYIIVYTIVDIIGRYDNNVNKYNK